MSTTGHAPERQFELLDDSAVPPASVRHAARALAGSRQRTPAAMVRQAVRQMLDGDPGTAAGQGAIVRGAGRSRIVKVTLRLEAAQASVAGRPRPRR